MLTATRVKHISTVQYEVTPSVDTTQAAAIWRSLRGAESEMSFWDKATAAITRGTPAPVKPWYTNWKVLAGIGAGVGVVALGVFALSR